MRYFTADLHIGDRAIARWRGHDDVATHDAMMLSGINETVGAGDELWVLGDVCHPSVAAVAAFRAAVACETVHVVVGNHDVAAKFRTAGGFATVADYAEVGKVAREGYKLCLSHYPMLDWNRAMHGSYMLHGHIHSLPAEGGGSGPRDRERGGMGVRGYNERNRRLGVRRYDVGVDANGYRPVGVDEIVAFFPGDAAWRATRGPGR